MGDAIGQTVRLINPLRPRSPDEPHRQATPLELFFWVLHYHPRSLRGRHVLLKPVAAALVLMTPFTGAPVLTAGLLLATLVAGTVIYNRWTATERVSAGTTTHHTPLPQLRHGLDGFEVAAAEGEQTDGDERGSDHH